MKSILVQTSDDTGELLRNTFLFGIGTIGSKFILFLLVPLYSSYMSADEFGNADLIVSSMSLIYPIFSLGIEQSVIRFGLTNVKDRADVLYISLVISTLGGLVLSLLTICVSCLVKIEYWYFVIILYFLIADSTIIESYAKVKEKNKTFAVNSIIKALSLCLMNILVLVVFRMGVLGYLISVAVSNMISIIFISIKCSVVSDIRKGHTKAVLKKNMLSYCLPLVPNTVSWWVTQLSDRYLVKFISGSIVNGLYTMAYKIPSVFNLVVSIFSQAFSLSVIKQIDRNDDNNNFTQIYSYYIAISFVFGSVIIVLSRWLSLILLKNIFYNAWVYIPILIFAFVVGNLQSFYGSLFAGLKLSKEVFKTTLAGAATNIILNVILIPRYEAYGAAVATVISYIIIYFTRMRIISKHLKFDHHVGKIIICIVMMCLQVVFYEQDNYLTTSFSIAFVIIYVLLYIKELKAIAVSLFKRISELNYRL